MPSTAAISAARSTPLRVSICATVINERCSSFHVLDKPFSITGRPTRRDPPNPVWWVPGRLDQLLRLRRRFDHRHHDAVDPDVEDPLDPHRVVPRRPDNNAEIAWSSPGRPNEVSDGLEAQFGVFRVDRDEVEASHRRGFDDHRVVDRSPSWKTGALSEQFGGGSKSVRVALPPLSSRPRPQSL